MTKEEHRIADAYMWASDQCLGHCDYDQFAKLVGSDDKELLVKAEKLAYEREESFVAPY